MFLIMYACRILQHKINENARSSSHQAYKQSPSLLSKVGMTRDKKQFQLVHFTARSWKPPSHFLLKKLPASC